MPQQPPLALLLARRERVTPAREGVLAGPQLDADRRAGELQRRAKRVLEITFVMIGQTLGLTAVHDDQRWIASTLVRVAQAHLPTAHERRRVREGRILE